MSSISYVCPFTGEKLSKQGNKYISKSKKSYPIIGKIPRFYEEQYSESFGFQWNKFDKLQLEASLPNLSNDRFWAVTNWDPKELENKNILEAGSGAGRFTEILIKIPKVTLYSFDSSSAVEANFKNNFEYISRLFICQASIYHMPYKNNSFDKLFCFGVLQHTPSFYRAVKELVDKVKPGGEIVIDFYPYKGFYTKIHSKYILRPITKRLPKRILLFLIEKYIDLGILLFEVLVYLKLGMLTRFIPITDIRGFPRNLDYKTKKNLAILDTFDAFSPKFDNPQRLKKVVKIFEGLNCKISFAGLVKYKNGSTTVVKAIKKK